MTAPTSTRRPVTADDLVRFRMADDPRLSPDGSTLAWVRTRIDADRDAYRSEIVLTDLATGRERRLTDRDVDADGSEVAPRWSPRVGGSPSWPPASPLRTPREPRVRPKRSWTPGHSCGWRRWANGRRRRPV